MCDSETKFVSCLDVAIEKGAKQENGSICGSEFDRLGIPMLGGCNICGETIGAYNAFPSKDGFLKCRSCIHIAGGFTSAKEMENFKYEED